MVLISTLDLGVEIDVPAQPQLAAGLTVDSKKSLNRAVLVGGPFILMMTGGAFVVGALSNVHFFRMEGLIAIAVAGGNQDLIIPEYINSAMSETFVIIFMVILLAAAMSTMSSQYQTTGSAIGHDFYRKFLMKGKSGQTVTVTRLGISVTILASVILAYYPAHQHNCKGHRNLLRNLCGSLPSHVCRRIVLERG
jgi:SSS family solute:Na+ symporter